MPSWRRWNFAIQPHLAAIARARPSRLNLSVASFQEFAEVCQSLSQTGSRLQMADIVGEFLARLDLDEAEIAARFMVGRSLAQGEEKRLQISGRAIWKIVAAMTGAEDQGEDIYNSAEDFGDAIGMLLKLRASEPEPTLTISEVAAKFAEIADIEGRASRSRKLAELTSLFERATALEGKYLDQSSDSRDAPWDERRHHARGDREDGAAAGRGGTSRAHARR